MGCPRFSMGCRREKNYIAFFSSFFSSFVSPFFVDFLEVDFFVLFFVVFFSAFSSAFFSGAAGVAGVAGVACANAYPEKDTAKIAARNNIPIFFIADSPPFELTFCKLPN
jgi:hypothetical protein